MFVVEALTVKFPPPNVGVGAAPNVITGVALAAVTVNVLVSLVFPELQAPALAAAQVFTVHVPVTALDAVRANVSVWVELFATLDLSVSRTNVPSGLYHWMRTSGRLPLPLTPTVVLAQTVAPVVKLL